MLKHIEAYLNTNQTSLFARNLNNQNFLIGRKPTAARNASKIASYNRGLQIYIVLLHFAFTRSFISLVPNIAGLHLMDWMICVDFKRFQVPRIPIEYRHGYLDYRRYPWNTRLNIDMVTFLLVNNQPPGHGVLVCTNASTKHNKNDNTRLWWRVLEWVYFKADLTEHACISLIHY